MNIDRALHEEQAKWADTVLRLAQERDEERARLRTATGVALKERELRERAEQQLAAMTAERDALKAELAKAINGVALICVEHPRGDSAALERAMRRHEDARKGLPNFLRYY